MIQSLFVQKIQIHSKCSTECIPGKMEAMKNQYKQYNCVTSGSYGQVTSRRWLSLNEAGNPY